jgi:hypothetical protein
MKVVYLARLKEPAASETSATDCKTIQCHTLETVHPNEQIYDGQPHKDVNYAFVYTANSTSAL